MEHANGTVFISTGNHFPPLSSLQMHILLAEDEVLVLLEVEGTF